MTIAAWVLTIIISLIIVGGAIFICCEMDSAAARILTILVAAILIIAIFVGAFSYFKCTASGQRSLVDEKANLHNGLDRTITIYTANGDIIATYTGKIDIEADKTYVKFDVDGKRYIYYNCFVETIANIDN